MTSIKETAEYRAYVNAKRRCENPKDKRWGSYGGRGIKFLFTNFDQFYAELGPRPKGRSLDRIENDGNYELGNVQWATHSAQQKNKGVFTHYKRHGKGCYYHKASGKWIASIAYMGKENYLGQFSSEVAGHRAYKKALKALNEKAPRPINLQ